MISRGLAALLDLDLTRPLRNNPLVGIGQTNSMPVVRLDQVQVEGSAVPNLLTSAFDLPPLFRADGLLGLNFLSHFRVTLEFDTRTLVLRPPPPSH